jgi:glycosyltransferase involved in cell wall biosynthesis
MSDPLRVLFVSHNFPPEVNAPARRLHDHGKQWVKDGGRLDVITDVPHFPEGVVHAGYRNRLTRETVEGMEVLRVPQVITRNGGAGNRILNYVSFMASAIWHSHRVEEKPDVVAATSPQMFTAIAGYVVSRLKRAPFVLEIRDLWPASAVSTGVLKRNAIVRFFEGVERFLYRKAAHIVVVTDSFRDYLLELGVPDQKITVLKNGVDLDGFGGVEDASALAGLRTEVAPDHGFVVSYVGTLGKAHGLEVILEAARRCPEPDILFLVVGAGAEREPLEARARELGLPNFRMVDKQPHERMRLFYALSDVSVIHLRDVPLFRGVIPSKIFESLAARRPIVLGVDGEARGIVEEAGAGIAFRPEDPEALLEAVLRLYREPELRRRMGDRGRRYAELHHDRTDIARSYWRLLTAVSLNGSGNGNGKRHG